jgi:hypothetical protein
MGNSLSDSVDLLIPFFRKFDLDSQPAYVTNEKAIRQQTSFLLTPFVVTEIAMRRNTVYDRRAHGALGALHLHECLA